MDNLQLFNKEEKEEILRKTNNERAEINLKKEKLSIQEICLLLFFIDYPIPKNEERTEWDKVNKKPMKAKNIFKKKLIKACDDGDVNYEGNINGWIYSGINPYPLAKKGDKKNKKFPTSSLTYFICRPDYCTIRKNDLKQYLEQIKQWPISDNCRLFAWWSGSNLSKSEVKKKRDTTQLHKLIWRVYIDLSENKKSCNCQAVWNEIKRNHSHYDDDEIIQEVTTDTISWKSSYSHEQTLKRTSFEPTLSKLKKNPPLENT